MIGAGSLPVEAADLARTIGLLTASGDFNASWFNDPFGSIESILSNQPQREALLRLLDAVLPPVSVPSVPAGEKWHPLLGAHPEGNAYLTVRDTADGIVIGVAGDYGTEADAVPVAARLSVVLPIVRAGSSVVALPGTDDGPLTVRLRVAVNLTPGAGGGIALRAVQVEARARPSAFSFVVVLEGLSLEGEPAADRVLDPESLGREIPQLIAGLLKQVVAQTSPAVARSVGDAIGLLGLADTSVPAFPFADLADDPAAVQAWITSLFAGPSPRPIEAWLGHFAGLFRTLFGAPPAVETGATPDSFSIALVPVGPDSTLRLTAAKLDGFFRIGLAARVSAVVDGRRFTIEAGAAVADIPLGGTARARVLPDAAAHLAVTGSAGALVDVGGAGGLRVGAVRAGLGWNGHTIVPELALVDVRIDGTTYPRLDLTNVDSVSALATNVVTAAIDAALGNGLTGRRLAALAGLVPPRNPANPAQPMPGWTRSLDLARFVTDPLAAIAKYHRDTLLDPVHGWDELFGEIVALVPGVAGAVSGAGTPADPWRIALAPPAGALVLDLAAWNAQTSGSAADVQQLRIGLRLAAAVPPVDFAWQAELLAFDLPAAGAGRVSIVGAQTMRVVVRPAFDGTFFDGEVHAAVDDVFAEMRWAPGDAIRWQAGVDTVRVDAGPDSFTVSSIAFPPAAGFDLSNPATAAAAFGLTPATLERLLSILIGQGAASLGEEVKELTALLGLHRFAAELPDDWPTLANPAAGGRLLTDPIAAAGDWLNRIVNGASADGSSFAATWLHHLRKTLGEGLDESAMAALESRGAGTYDEPWTLPVPGSASATSAQFHLWIDPAGPPASLAAGLHTLAGAAATFDDLGEALRGLGAYDDGLRCRLSGRSDEHLSDGFELLDDLLLRSDGIVPLASQLPSIAGWTLADPIVAAHASLPSDASAIALVAAQVDAFAGGAAAPRVVLLLAPGLAGPNPWDALLASPAAHGVKDPAARFALDDPSIPDPRTFSLSGVTAAADWYVAQLPNDDLPDWSGHAQLIGRIVDRIGALRPGVPVTIVAHSTVGLAARHYAAGNQARVKGLITLATPHVGATLPFSSDTDLADAIRAASLLINDVPAGPVRDSLLALATALDGYAPPATAGALPVDRRFPFAAFDTTGAALDVGDVPVYAIGATVSTAPLLDLLKPAILALATRAGAAARPAPTHIGLGVSIPLALPAADVGDVAAEARMRVDLLEIPLTSPPAAPPRPSQGLRFSARLFRPDDWLLGGPSAVPIGASTADARAAFVDVRARELEFGLDARKTASGIEARPWINLVDAAFHGPTVPRAREADAITSGVVGEVFRSLSSGIERPGGPAASLIEGLAAIGIVGPDSRGELGFLADAWAAIEADALAFLGTRLPDALAAADGWLGIIGPAGGPWTFAVADTSIELRIERFGTRGPWQITIHSDEDGPAEEGAADETEPAHPFELAFGATIDLPSLDVDVELAATVGAAELEWDAGIGTLTLHARPWLDALRLLPPPSAAALQAALSDLWPRVLFSSAFSVAVRSIVPDLKVAALERFLRDTDVFLHDLFVLTDRSGLSVARIRVLLDDITRLMDLPTGGGVPLPADLRVTADGDGTAASPLRLSVATTADIGGVLGFAFGVLVDPSLHATPHAQITLTEALDGTWGTVGVRFGADARGVTLVVTPGGGITPIELLPNFGGLGALRGAAAALLPRALDQLVTELGLPQPAWLQRLLDVAVALDLYAAPGGFAAKVPQLQALAAGNLASTFDATRRNQIALACAQALQSLPALPGAATQDGGRVRFTLNLPPGVTGQIGLVIGFDASAPTVGVFVDDLHIADAFIARATLVGSESGIQCEGRFGVVLAPIHLAVTPRIDFGIDTGAGDGFRLFVRPLANGIDEAANGPLEIRLAPDFALTMAAGSIDRLLTDWALPLVVSTLLEVTRGHGLLARELWSVGSAAERVTVQQLLEGASIVDAAGQLVTPLPDVWPMIAGGLATLATGVSIPIGDLTLALVNEAGRLGVGLTGIQKFALDDFTLDVLFGAPHEWTERAGADEGTPEVSDGIQVFLLRTGGATPEFDVGLELSGVGLGIDGPNGLPLVDDPSVRIGGVRAYAFVNVETSPGLSTSRLGGGLEIRDFGLPLGAVTSGAGGGNPVVSALLSQGGAGGDTQPPNPGVDIDVWYREDDALHVRMGGESGVLWIGVHSKFGPIYIDQVGVRLTSDEAGLLVDGGVQVAGLTAQVDDLTLIVPYRTAGDPSTWTLDLKGMGLGYSGPGIAISGGLVKYDPPIEYDGMLLVKIGTIGAIAVGSYSVPEEAGGDSYTSLAIFGGVFVPIGLTPIINITALGIGLGLNRRLIVPDDLNQIPGFFLIQALDRPEEFANDPLGALLRFRNAVPARRGAFWLAAGLRGTSFEIVNITAVIYVALDGGVEVGLLGLARASLPADEAALVSVELALKARFSSAEMLFSIQAQLTDNSWLLSSDCQLTGGFAYFMWFRESQFLLSLGGYHPSFQRRPEYPNVPRLGYRWNVLGIVHIKGESYFALTNTCVMAGTLMEATYGPDWIQLWFTAHADLLAQWDPFYFIADVGISVGARFRIKICFFGCVRITITVSVGATMHLEGPPLHGSVTVDLAIASITIPFGDTPRPKPQPLPWDQFTLKYLQGSDPATLAVSAQVSVGLLAPEPPGAPAAPGTETQPWKLAPEWVFQTETRMPARGFTFVEDTAITAWDPATTTRFSAFTMFPETYDIDLAPMGEEEVTSEHKIFIERRSGSTWARMTAADLDRDRFVLEPRIGQVSEASFRLFSGLPPAAANTLPALVGLTVRGIAELRSTTPTPIPIARLRDATNPRPLPFARPDAPIWVDIQIAGRQAEHYFAFGGALKFRAALDAASKVLSGVNNVYADNRATSGIPVAGLGPVASRALVTRRSAPPLVAPLSAGLSMKPVGQDPPVAIDRLEPVAPLPLTAPRLRAVMQARVRATSAAGAVLRTTVGGRRGPAASVTTVNDTPIRTLVVGRDLNRHVVVGGARLDHVPRAGAPRATRFATTAASVRSPEIGAAAAPATRKAFSQIESDVIRDGATVRAGVTQLWDVPAHAATLVMRGDLAVRVTLLSRGGGVISDREYGDARELSVPLPDQCAMVAVGGLGLSTAVARSEQVPPGPGAVTSFAAPPGRSPAVGWQSSDEAIQVAGSTLLARGSVIRLSQSADVSLKSQALNAGVVPLSRAIAPTAGVETHLPPHVRVVAVTLEASTVRLPGDDDLQVAVRNGTLQRVPVRVGAGQRAMLLFDVTPAGPALEGIAPIVIAVTTVADVRLSAVVGLSGTAREWGETLNGRLPEDWVPDEPLTPDGTSRLRFVLRD